MSRRRLCALFAVLLSVLPPAARPAPAADVPPAAEVQELLRREPITAESWPSWRVRLRDWIGDRTSRTDAAYQAAYQFLRDQVRPNGALPPGLKDDALAWYFLSSAYLRGSDAKSEAIKAEGAARNSLDLDPKFARAHRNLARALCLRDGPPVPGQPPGRMHQEAERELEQAHSLDPALSLSELRGEIAMQERRFAEAEGLFAAARREVPDDVLLAQAQATAVLMNEKRQGGHAPAVKDLLDRFPEDGTLVTLHGVALAADGDARAGAREIERARRLGFDPTQVAPASVLQQIEEQGAPSLAEQVGWGAVYFVALYAAVMLFMTVAGWGLARYTRGTRALQLLGSDPSELIAGGQVARSRHESWLASLYALLLVLGLLLFYAAIPFLVVGILGATAGLLYLIFLMPRIPIRLVLIVVVVGLGGAWALFKSLFARPRSGAFGLAKTAADCPRLYEALGEVARRVDTRPVDAVYLAPGSSIGVHQEGRGPFGIFGVKQRVLTLGLSTMNFLTVGELKAILAHEYAHFSHSDTFYNRFIYQVALSLGEAMNGMGRTGGRLTYVNPFYWFLYLYYKAYNLLSSGFSRSREFLADRMAAGLYGSDVFATALKKVCTEGTLFEMTMYDNVARLLAENKAFTNVYEAFRNYRNEQLSEEEREKVYNDLLTEKESLFASHPTFRERIEAVAPLPKAERPDETPAARLFENAEALEKELTEFITGYVAYVQRMRSQAAQQ